MSQRSLNVDRILQLLLRDAVSTLGEHARAEVLAVAANVQATARLQMQPVEAGPHWGASEGSSLAEAQRFYDRELVDQFQQTVHDLHWDTTWPACLWHPNHPLWYSEEREAWCCARDGSLAASLGELASIRPPAT